MLLSSKPIRGAGIYLSDLGEVELELLDRPSGALLAMKRGWSSGPSSWALFLEVHHLPSELKVGSPYFLLPFLELYLKSTD
ncbi:hypothetical protein Nepgr_023235 [Nepenthes gracilis]|uniref:Uncharacterized protein n=1 Tax=Nepenthes gracilis TaxID=150966 RepID=A0AAD3T0B9_NEPGR|nr:hypothetical protein Nepgr_023235 [Nepenthes gracilis]